MADPIFHLLATPDGWRVAGEAGEAFDIDIEAALESPASEVAARSSEVMNQKGYRGQGIVVAIPSAWCFAASIATSDLPRNDRKAMAYRLEEKLPIAAEGMVADFIVRHGGEALGICARIEPLRALIDALEDRSIAVQSMVPVALLAAQGMFTQSPEHAAIILLADKIFGDGSVEILHFDAGQLVHWATVPESASDVQLHLDMVSMNLGGAAAIETCGVGPDVNGMLKKYALSVNEHKVNLVSSVLRAGQRIIGGQDRPWIELRRGALAVGDRLRLYRRPLNAALAAGVVLMLGLVGAMMLRAHRYASIEASANEKIVDAFREQFPGWEVPVNVRAVIESEHRKAVLAGASAGLTAGAKGRSAIDTFKNVLEQLPGQGKVLIKKMSFDESSFDLDGQVKSYEQLDGIAAAAAKAGMEVAAPESRKNAEGFWDFTMHGAMPVAPAGRAADEVAKGGGE